MLLILASKMGGFPGLASLVYLMSSKPMRDLVSKQSQKCTASGEHHLMPSGTCTTHHTNMHTHVNTSNFRRYYYITKKNLDDHITNVV